METNVKNDVVLVASFLYLASLSHADLQTLLPFDQPGAVAGKQKQGDGLSVVRTTDGAQLRCVFQQLEGKVTAESLWLVSTGDNANGDRLRVTAEKMWRLNAVGSSSGWSDLFDWLQQSLPTAVRVEVAEDRARCICGDFTEDYSVSMDGVQQDFVIAPAGKRALRAAAPTGRTRDGAATIISQCST